MLEHYVRKDSPPPPRSPPSKYNTLKRSLDDCGMPPSKKSSVFSRLGDNSVSSTTDSPKVTITMLGRDGLQSREKSSSTRPIIGKMHSDYMMDYDSQSSSGPLEYQGILKYSSKEIAQKNLNNNKPKVKTMKADTTTGNSFSSSGIKSRLGMKSKSVVQSEGIFAKDMDFSLDFPKKPTEKKSKPAKMLIITKTRSPSPPSSPSMDMPVAHRTFKTMGLIKSNKKLVNKSKKEKPIYISEDSSPQITIDSESSEDNLPIPAKNKSSSSTSSTSESSESDSSVSPPPKKVLGKKSANKKILKSKSKKSKKKKKKSKEKAKALAAALIMKKRKERSDSNTSTSSSSSDESSRPSHSPEVIRRPIFPVPVEVPSVPSGKRIIKTIIKRNKRTGEVLSQETREVKSDVFNRLDD